MKINFNSELVQSSIQDVLNKILLWITMDINIIHEFGWSLVKIVLYII